MNDKAKEAIFSHIENGYTIKKDGLNCYRMFNKERKLYFVLYGGSWCIGETSNYRLCEYDVKMPERIPI